MCESWSAQADAVSNKAAVVAALIDEIEAKGFACEVIFPVPIRLQRKYQGIDVRSCQGKPSACRYQQTGIRLRPLAMFRVFMFASWQSDDFAKELGLG